MHFFFLFWFPEGKHKYYWKLGGQEGDPTGDQVWFPRPSKLILTIGLPQVNLA